MNVHALEDRIAFRVGHLALAVAQAQISERNGSVSVPSRAKFIEAIVEPSREIPPNYTNWTLVTRSGKVHAGLILQELDGRVVLGTSEGREVEIKTADIEKRVVQNVSLMPKDLVDQMTVEEFRDLVAFLKSSQ